MSINNTKQNNRIGGFIHTLSSFSLFLHVNMRLSKFLYSSKTKYRNQNLVSGFTLLFASLISALVLSIGLAILNVTLKQISLSIAGRESQQSFYSADAGTECALYFKQGAGITDCEGGVYYIPDPSGVPVAFCESAAVYDTFECLGQQIDLSYTTLGSGAVDNTFSVSTASNDDSNQDICFSVDVVKQSDGTTIIESRGYNICGANGKYERAVLSRFDPVL